MKWYFKHKKGVLNSKTRIVPHSYHLLSYSCVIFFPFTYSGRYTVSHCYVLFILFIYLFAFSRATPMAHGGSQARGLIGAVAADLHQSHSNAGSEPCLQPIPQFMAMPDP